MTLPIGGCYRRIWAVKRIEVGDRMCEGMACESVTNKVNTAAGRGSIVLLFIRPGEYAPRAPSRFVTVPMVRISTVRLILNTVQKVAASGKEEKEKERGWISLLVSLERSLLDGNGGTASLSGVWEAPRFTAGPAPRILEKDAGRVRG